MDSGLGVVFAMAMGNSGDGSRGANGGDRPGSYVKVTGGRRRRKPKRLRPSDPSGLARTSAPPAASEPSIREDRESASEHIDYAVDDLRPSRSMGNRTARRALGPLGINDPHNEPSGPPASGGAPRSPLPASPRLNVVEINPPEEIESSAAKPSSTAAEHTPARAAAPVPAPGNLHERVTRADREQPVEREPTARVTHAGLGEHERVTIAEESGLAAQERVTRPDDDLPVERDLLASGEEAMERAASAASGEAMQRDAPAASQIQAEAGSADGLVGRDSHSSPHAGDVALRPSLSSVFGARASMRPSPPPPPRSPLVWWLVVGVLSSIIGAAAFIAVRETLREPPRPIRRASAPAAREPAPPPPMQRAPQRELAPPPAAPPAVEPAQKDATVARKVGAARPRPLVPARPRKPRLAPTPAAPIAPAPSDGVADPRSAPAEGVAPKPATTPAPSANPMPAPSTEPPAPAAPPPGASVPPPPPAPQPAPVLAQPPEAAPGTRLDEMNPYE